MLQNQINCPSNIQTPYQYHTHHHTHHHRIVPLQTHWAKNTDNNKKQQIQIKQISTILSINTKSQSQSKPELNNRSQSQTRGHSKIKQISQLINTYNQSSKKKEDKNLCTTKSINLNNQNLSTDTRQKKKKLEVSLSKQKAQNKQRSISQRSGNKGTKLKISLNQNTSHQKERAQPIRKIKDFQVSELQKQEINKIKTARLIKNLQNCSSLANNLTNHLPQAQYQSNPYPHSLAQEYHINKEVKKKQHKITSININLNNDEGAGYERRKIRLHRNR